MTYIADMKEYATIRKGGRFSNPSDHGPDISADSFGSAVFKCHLAHGDEYEVFGPLQEVSDFLYVRDMERLLALPVGMN